MPTRKVTGGAVIGIPAGVLLVWILNTLVLPAASPDIANPIIIPGPVRSAIGSILSFIASYFVRERAWVENVEEGSVPLSDLHIDWRSLTRQINPDCQKLRRFAMRLLASGYLRRYATFNCCDPYSLGINATDIKYCNDEYFKMKSTTGYLNYSCWFALEIWY